MAARDTTRTLIGVRIVGHGSLEQPEFGHQPGTSYVVIQADCVAEAQSAREYLAPIARIPRDRWHGSWTPRRLNGSYVLERKIFPTLDSLLGRLSPPASA